MSKRNDIIPIGTLTHARPSRLAVMILHSKAFIFHSPSKLKIKKLNSNKITSAFASKKTRWSIRGGGRNAKLKRKYWTIKIKTFSDSFSHPQVRHLWKLGGSKVFSYLLIFGHYSQTLQNYFFDYNSNVTSFSFSPVVASSS